MVLPNCSVQVSPDDILQHLVLTALTVDVEKIKILSSSSSRDIADHQRGLHDVKTDFLSSLLVGIFHPKCSLTSQVLRSQEDSPGGVTQAVVVDTHPPLVVHTVFAPDFFQIFIKSRDWLVNMQRAGQSNDTYSLWRCCGLNLTIQDKVSGILSRQLRQCYLQRT